MTLFWKPEGPLISYADGMLGVYDLNPENEMRWRMSRGELFALAWRCTLAALRGGQ